MPRGITGTVIPSACKSSYVVTCLAPGTEPRGGTRDASKELGVQRGVREHHYPTVPMQPLPTGRSFLLGGALVILLDLVSMWVFILIFVFQL